jgi:RNA polymerase sigma-70 factor (ECF subfamily)
MALMCFHASRINSRLNVQGELILLAKQDRKQWTKELIVQGNHYLNKGATGDRLSSYHLEAAIAYEHCTAKKYEDCSTF